MGSAERRTTRRGNAKSEILGILARMSADEPMTEPSPALVRVVFQPSEREARVPPGTTLWQAALIAHMPVGALCGGELSCGLCRVDVVYGHANLLAPTEDEAKTLRAIHAAPEERLACKARVTGPGEVAIKATYW